MREESERSINASQRVLTSARAASLLAVASIALHRHSHAVTHSTRLDSDELSGWIIAANRSDGVDECKCKCINSSEFERCCH